MEYQYFFDNEIGKTHSEKHNVSEEEIDEFFTEVKYYTLKRSDGSLSSIGKLKTGRFLNIIYRRIDLKTIFIITAFDIEDRSLINMIMENEEK